MHNVLSLRNCYITKYGVRGRSGSLGASQATDSILVDETDSNMCPRCGGKVFEAEKVMYVCYFESI